jgi:hypothetical protein
MGNTRWVLPSQSIFFHMQELRIEPLTTCLRVLGPLPLGLIHCWFLSKILNEILLCSGNQVNFSRCLIFKKFRMQQELKCGL